MAKYKSVRRFDFAYENKRYAIGSTKEVVIEGEPTPDDQPKKVICHPETQEVLKYLHELGHDGVVIDDKKNSDNGQNQE